MVDVYRQAGVQCHFLDADEGLTSSVYARDSSFMTPWGPVVASIQTPPRRRDYAVVASFFAREGIPIWKWVTAGHFEGGDFGIIEPGVVVLGYAGNRSTKEGAEQVAGWMAAEGWETLTVPLAPQFVHLDATLVMLADKYALVCEDALEDYVLDFLRGARRELDPGRLPRLRQARRQPGQPGRRADPVHGPQHHGQRPARGRGLRGDRDRVRPVRPGRRRRALLLPRAAPRAGGGGMSTPRFQWPDGSRCACVVSFDVDAESAILQVDRKYATHATTMSHQAYGPRVGVPRLLEQLRAAGIRATFFVPGFTAECYPDTIRRIVADGHEVGWHGYMHELPLDLTVAEQRSIIERAAEVLEPLTGDAAGGLPRPVVAADAWNRPSCWPAPAFATTRA